MLILNIAAGKFDPLDINEKESNLIVNVDTCYFGGYDIADMERNALVWMEDPLSQTQTYYINSDVFNFMERTILKFDKVCIYRFLEHVSFTQLEYFIYLVSTILNKDGIVDVIVPNYSVLAERIINETQRIEENNFENCKNFQAWNTELTTELLNEPSCPHASIWTPYRAKYFWELENRFIVEYEAMVERFMFDGRNIYLRFFAKRI